MQTLMKKNILIPAVAFTAFSVIAGALIILSMYLHHHRFVFTYSPAEYTETSDPLANPYQGWYCMYGYALSDSSPVYAETIQKHIQHSANDQLVLLEINLKEYASKDLSSVALSQLETIFSAWKQSSQHMILRFLYDWSGNAQLTEPASETIIMRHMDQTAEIINKYADAIYLMQGIFIGNYGEMHGSAYLNDASIRRLTEHLAGVIDPSIYLSVRTPQHWRTVTERFDPLPESSAWNGSVAARLGLFNDGLLGSATDLGTYSESDSDVLPAAKSASDYSAKGNRSEELRFQNKLCSYVPNGGETVVDNPCNDFSSAVSALADMHISYLNRTYDANVLKKWELFVYQGSDCFQGMNGLDYIGRHLGYRYTIKDSALTYHPRGKDPAVIQLTIANNGFSNCYLPLTAECILFHTETKEFWTIPVDTDARYWSAGSSTALSVPLRADSYPPGNYIAYFKLADASTGRQIQLANTLTADDTFGYPIASLQIQK